MQIALMNAKDVPGLSGKGDWNDADLEILQAFKDKHNCLYYLRTGGRYIEAEAILMAAEQGKPVVLLEHLEPWSSFGRPNPHYLHWDEIQSVYDGWRADLHPYEVAKHLNMSVTEVNEIFTELTFGNLDASDDWD